MGHEAPASNVDNVASNLVHHAIVDDVYNPGNAIAELLEKMARVARDVGGAARAANADWHGVIGPDGDKSQIEPMAARQFMTMGDMWAQEWLLCNMAKHLHELLKYRCLQYNHVPAAIESIDYEEDGTVRSWKQRKDSAEQSS